MKTTQFESMKSKAEVFAVFAKQNASAAKTLLKLQGAIDKIESTTERDIVSYALDYVRTSFNSLPKDLKRDAKLQFTAACYESIDKRGKLYFMDINGNVSINRVISSISYKYNKDLFVLLSNLLQDAAKGNIEAAEAAEAAEAEEQRNNAYLSVLDEEIAQYKKCA